LACPARRCDNRGAQARTQHSSDSGIYSKQARTAPRRRRHSPPGGGITLTRALAIAACLLAATPLLAATQADLDLAAEMAARYDRTSSPVMVRVLNRQDRGALELAAYDANSVFHYPMTEALKAPAAEVPLDALSFDGALEPDTLADRVGDTPLTADELDHGMAWRAISKYISEWDWDAAEPIMDAEAKVEGETFGNEGLVRPIASLAVAYLHGGELWAKVELRPEVTFVAVDDEDGDGYREVYGRVPLGASAEAVVTELRDNYLGTPLSLDDMETAFFELASDWYGELQTVALEPDLARPWPNDETEPQARDAMAGKSFDDALAVLRSKPYGEPIYNVFLLDAKDAVAAPGDDPWFKPIRPKVANPWAEEPATFGGSWEAWTEALKPFDDDVQAMLDARPEALKGLIGRDDWLFFRGDLSYLLSGELRGKPEERDPYPAIVHFRDQLRRKGIDLLVAFIPTKGEVYPEKLSANAPGGARPYVAPYCRKLMSDLADAGVEMVDLLPAFIDARDADPDLLYQRCDTHWTNRGARLAASLIAERVQAYPWYATLDAKPAAYSTKEATFKRRGDICEMLAADEKRRFPPEELTALQVLGPGGALYEDDEESPIVVLGDSFTGVFEFEDCKHAGLTAHMARELGVPIDLVMAQGSGPTIRGQFVRRGAEEIAKKKLVVWTVVSRDLYHYWSPWKEIEVP
jgi:hypothetical protein